MIVGPEPASYDFHVKPASDVHVEWVDGEAVVLNPKTNEFHYLNSAAALMYALILEYGYEQGVVRIRQMKRDEPDIEAQLNDFVSVLLDKGLLIGDA